MKSAPPRAPILRALYGVVFLGAASAAFAAGWPELQQLIRAWSAPYHFGDPPRVLTLFGLALVTCGVAGIIRAFLTGREVKLLWSALVLFGAASSVAGLGSAPPQGRSWAAADKEILAVASRIQREMVDVLQADGEVPKVPIAWENVLKLATKDLSPARDRSFSRLPYRITHLKEEAERPNPLVPGTLLVHLAPQGEAFSIAPIGFDTKGQVAQLADDRGEPLTLRGTFNPDVAQPSGDVLPSLPGVLPPTAGP